MAEETVARKAAKRVVAMVVKKADLSVDKKAPLWVD